MGHNFFRHNSRIYATNRWFWSAPRPRLAIPWKQVPSRVSPSAQDPRSYLRHPHSTPIGGRCCFRWGSVNACERHTARAVVVAVSLFRRGHCSRWTSGILGNQPRGPPTGHDGGSTPSDSCSVLYLSEGFSRTMPAAFRERRRRVRFFAFFAFFAFFVVTPCIRISRKERGEHKGRALQSGRAYRKMKI